MHPAEPETTSLASFPSVLFQEWKINPPSQDVALLLLLKAHFPAFFRGCSWATARALRRLSLLEEYRPVSWGGMLWWLKPLSYGSSSLLRRRFSWAAALQGRVWAETTTAPGAIAWLSPSVPGGVQKGRRTAIRRVIKSRAVCWVKLFPTSGFSV